MEGNILNNPNHSIMFVDDTGRPIIIRNQSNDGTVIELEIPSTTETETTVASVPYSVIRFVDPDDDDQNEIFEVLRPVEKTYKVPIKGRKRIRTLPLQPLPPDKGQTLKEIDLRLETNNNFFRFEYDFVAQALPSFGTLKDYVDEREAKLELHLELLRDREFGAATEEAVACCVPKCPYSYVIRRLPRQFYSLSPFRGRFRDDWVKAIIDGSSPFLPNDWVPKPNDKICSGHFYKGKKSTNPLHPSFVPVFFYRTQEEETEAECKRREREFLFRQRSAAFQRKKNLEKRKIDEFFRMEDEDDDDNEEEEGQRFLYEFPKSLRVDLSPLKSGRVCSVVGCYNSTLEYRRGDKKFFRFPGLDRADQRRKWIAALDRINPDGSTWTPGPKDVICSDHFYRGVPNSSSKYHPSYVPICFPQNRAHWRKLRKKADRLFQYVKRNYVIGRPLEPPPFHLMISTNDDEKVLDPSVVTIKYPGWKEEMADYIRRCQKLDLFTDMVVTNGDRSFRGHRILMMSSLPMLKQALFDSSSNEEEAYVCLPFMSNRDMVWLEKIVYGASTDESVKEEEDDWLNSIDCSSTSPTAAVPPVTTTAVIPAPSPQKQLTKEKRLKLLVEAAVTDKKITVDNFFRLYNGLTSKLPKNTTFENVPQLGNVNVNAPPAKTIESIVKKVKKIRADTPKKLVVRKDNKVFSVFVQTVKAPDQLNQPPPPPKIVKPTLMSSPFEPKEPTCIVCEKVFRTIIERDEHKVEAHLGADDTPGSKTCRYCEKEFRSIVNRRIHETKHQRGSWKCHICDKGYSLARKLQGHIYAHEGVARYICQFCSKGFTDKDMLRNHEAMHQNVSKFKCQFCHRLFRTCENLSHHENVHKGLKPFVCEKCGKCVTSRTQLITHKRTHQPQELFGQYQCKSCSKRFRYKITMQNHSRICSVAPND